MPFLFDPLQGIGISSVALALAGAQRFEQPADRLLDSFRTLVHREDVPCCVVGGDGHLIEGNKALEEFIGWPLDILREKHFGDFTVEEYVDSDVALYGVCIDPDRKPDMYGLEKGWYTFAGDKVFGWMNVTAIFSQDGEFAFSYVTIRPIKKNAEIDEREMKQFVESKNKWVQLAQVVDGSSRMWSLVFALVLIFLTLGFSIFLAANGKMLLELIFGG